MPGMMLNYWINARKYKISAKLQLKLLHSVGLNSVSIMFLSTTIFKSFFSLEVSISLRYVWSFHLVISFGHFSLRKRNCIRG